jgi:hypothetical protein
LLTGFKPERLADLTAEMYRRSPESPRTVALRMRIAARDPDDAQLERLVRLTAPHTSDPLLARGAGLALFERLRSEAPLESGARQRMRDQAFEYLDRAAMSRPDDADAIWAYGMLAAELQRELPTALRRVQNMSAIMPSNADLTIALAELKGASGAPQDRLRLLNDALRYSRSLEQRRWLVQQLKTASRP